MLLLGHRGARKQAPENTLEAFDLCLAHGCDGFEFDVRCTHDRRTILCHDARSRGRSVSRNRFETLCRPGTACLEDVLQRYPRAFLNIEVKVAGVEDLVVEALTEWPPKRFVVSSFLPEVLRALYELRPDFPLALLIDSHRMMKRWEALPVMGVFPHHLLSSEALIRDLQQAGKFIVIWTVNSERKMLRYRDWGVDGLISDDTEKLVRVLGGK